MKKRWILLLLLSLCTISCNAAPATTPLEIGTVKYLRDFDEASALSKKSGKPIFAFFQEVPG